MYAYPLPVVYRSQIISITLACILFQVFWQLEAYCLVYFTALFGLQQLLHNRWEWPCFWKLVVVSIARQTGKTSKGAVWFAHWGPCLEHVECHDSCTEVHALNVIASLYNALQQEGLYWGIPSSDGIHYGLVDFFFFFFSFSSVSFRRQIWHSQRPNTMKEILHSPDILGKPSFR